MNPFEVNMLCLCLVLVGMVTLLPLNTWKRMPKKESAWLVGGMVGYFLITLSWGYFPVLTAILVGGMAIGRMLSLVFMATREEYSLPLTLNLVANAALMSLLSITNR